MNYKDTVDLTNRIKLLLVSEGCTSADFLKNVTKMSSTEHLAMKYSLPTEKQDYTLGVYTH